MTGKLVEAWAVQSVWLIRQGEAIIKTKTRAGKRGCLARTHLPNDDEALGRLGSCALVSERELHVDHLLDPCRAKSSADCVPSFRSFPNLLVLSLGSLEKVGTSKVG